MQESNNNIRSFFSSAKIAQSKIQVELFFNQDSRPSLRLSFKDQELVSELNDDFSILSYLYNADLYNADLYNADLYNADLYNADLYNAGLLNNNGSSLEFFNKPKGFWNIVWSWMLAFWRFLFGNPSQSHGVNSSYESLKACLLEQSAFFKKTGDFDGPSFLEDLIFTGDLQAIRSCTDSKVSINPRRGARLVVHIAENHRFERNIPVINYERIFGFLIKQSQKYHQAIGIFLPHDPNNPDQHHTVMLHLYLPGKISYTLHVKYDRCPFLKVNSYLKNVSQRIFYPIKKKQDFKKTVRLDNSWHFHEAVMSLLEFKAVNRSLTKNRFYKAVLDFVCLFKFSEIRKCIKTMIYVDKHDRLFSTSLEEGQIKLPKAELLLFLESFSELFESVKSELLESLKNKKRDEIEEEFYVKLLLLGKEFLNHRDIQNIYFPKPEQKLSLDAFIKRDKKNELMLKFPEDVWVHVFKFLDPKYFGLFDLSLNRVSNENNMIGWWSYIFKSLGLPYLGYGLSLNLEKQAALSVLSKRFNHAPFLRSLPSSMCHQFLPEASSKALAELKKVINARKDGEVERIVLFTYQVLKYFFKKEALSPAPSEKTFSKNIELLVEQLRKLKTSTFPYMGHTVAFEKVISNDQGQEISTENKKICLLNLMVFQYKHDPKSFLEFYYDSVSHATELEQFNYQNSEEYNHFKEEMKEITEIQESDYFNLFKKYLESQTEENPPEENPPAEQLSIQNYKNHEKYREKYRTFLSLLEKKKFSLFKEYLASKSVGALIGLGFQDFNLLNELDRLSAYHRWFLFILLLRGQDLSNSQVLDCVLEHQEELFPEFINSDIFQAKRDAWNLEYLQKKHVLGLGR